MSAPRVGLGLVPIPPQALTAAASLLGDGIKKIFTLGIGEGRNSADAFNRAYFGEDGRSGVLKFILDNYNLDVFRSPLLPTNGGNRQSLRQAEENLRKVEEFWTNDVLPRVTDSRVRPQAIYVISGMDPGGGRNYGSFPWAREAIRQQYDALARMEAAGTAPVDSGAPYAAPDGYSDVGLSVGLPGSRTTRRTVTNSGLPVQVSAPGPWDAVVDDIWGIVGPRVNPQQAPAVARQAGGETPWALIGLAGVGLYLLSGKKGRK